MRRADRGPSRGGASRRLGQDGSERWPGGADRRLGQDGSGRWPGGADRRLSPGEGEAARLTGDRNGTGLAVGWAGGLTDGWAAGPGWTGRATPARLLKTSGDLPEDVFSLVKGLIAGLGGVLAVTRCLPRALSQLNLTAARCYSAACGLA